MLTYCRLNSNIFVHPSTVQPCVQSAHFNKSDLHHPAVLKLPPWFVAAIVAAVVWPGWRGTSVFDVCLTAWGRRFGWVGLHVGRAVWI